MTEQVVLSALVWGFYTPQLLFWMTTSWMIRSRQHGMTPSDRIRVWFRLSRRCVWPCYAGYCVANLWDVESVSSLVITLSFLALVFWFNWTDWKRSKGLDDDDWTKRLVEWGQGVVERVGNKLAVVVPAPAGA